METIEEMEDQLFVYEKSRRRRRRRDKLQIGVESRAADVMWLKSNDDDCLVMKSSGQERKKKKNCNWLKLLMQMKMMFVWKELKRKIPIKKAKKHDRE